MAANPARKDAFLAKLQSEYLLADGAMGSMLMKDGGNWTVPEELNLGESERVRTVHSAYAAAGSSFVVTNTFGGSPAKLALVGLADKAREINLRAAEIAREAVGENFFVGGSLGPTGRFLEPLGDLTEAEATEGYSLQVDALVDGGVDFIILETMSAIDEVTIALKAASASGLPVVVSMTYEPNGRTMMGARLEDLIAFGKEDGVVALGLNCGQGPETMLKLVERLRELDSEVPLVAQPNAGAPRLSGANAVYDVGPGDLARFALSARILSVKVIGACCGSTPEHIRAMARALGD